MLKSVSRRLALWLALFLFWGSVFWGGWQLLTNPNAGLPREWNPLEPLVISDRVTPFTGMKLRRALQSGPACIVALETGRLAARALEDLVDGERCGIKNRVELSGVGLASLSPVETTCAIALTMAMWEEHSLQTAARSILGTELTKIDHLSSYNCREIRTLQGTGGRMSLHATAEAIDISGFHFADGRHLWLRRDWNNDGPEAEFLKAARDGACDWFQTTLGPDYNTLHADHFHLQSRGWGTCR